MTDDPFSNKPSPRATNQIVSDIAVAMQQPWGLRPPAREIISPEEAWRRYERYGEPQGKWE